jgi:hypothetical protein
MPSLSQHSKREKSVAVEKDESNRLGMNIMQEYHRKWDAIAAPFSSDPGIVKINQSSNICPLLR